MNIIEAIKNYKKIRRKIWYDKNTYIFVKTLDDYTIYMCDENKEISSYSLLSFDVVADDWEEYKETTQPAKKVIDCLVINSDYENIINGKIKENENKGYEILSLESNPDFIVYGWRYTLKMVKYED
jgi:L-rhamnose mutarotase